MRHGSLFSGIGGFDLAAQWMGWENVFQVEWDGWCQKVLSKNFPNTLRFGDIVEFNNMLEDGKIIADSKSNRRKINEYEKQILEDSEKQIREYGENIKEGSSLGCEPGRHGYNRNGSDRISIGNIDIITGGFPCQPFSHAGKRKGTDDSRYLWPEMLTTIRILKPAFVVGENVAGLVSMDNGKTFDRILSDLANEGYTTEQFIIPACAVGAWHRRDRIWIVGINTNNNTVRCDNGKCTIKERSKRRSESFKWKSESSLDGMANGISSWMDEPEGVPRVATGIQDRVNRLKGLGNAIVPQIAFEIFKAIEKLTKPS